MLSKTHRKASKKIRERYQNLSEEEKEKKQEKVRMKYQNLTKEEKEKKTH